MCDGIDYAISPHLLMPASGRNHQRGISLVMLRLEIRLRADKDMRDKLVVRYSCEHESCPATCLGLVNCRAIIEQEASTLMLILEASHNQGGVSLITCSVDRRPRLEQRPCARLMTFEACLHQGGGSLQHCGGSLEIRPCLDQ